MQTKSSDSLIEEINRKLGDRAFFTLRELISVGVFGSLISARSALKEGRLTFVRISPRRCIVPRSALLEFINRSFSKNDSSSTFG